MDHEPIPRTEPLRAIIADDDSFARRTIKDVLQAAGIIAIAEAHNGREAVELTLFYRPDVVLMDVVMPEMNGIAATRRIVEQIPGQIVVLLASNDEDDLAILGLRTGAVGFLTKDMDINALPRVLERALDGEAVVNRRLGMKLIEQLRAAPNGRSGLRPIRSPLTTREWEIVDLLCDGLSTDDIASALVLSSETVRSHVKSVLSKLGAHSRREAVGIAQRMRGVPPGEPLLD
jgi:two-component system, NarL family, response regulator LiaR